MTPAPAQLGILFDPGQKRKNLIDNRPRRFTLNPLYAMKTEVLWYLGERSIEIRETEIPEFETREVLQRSPPRATPFRAKIGSQRNFHRTHNMAVAIGPELKNIREISVQGGYREKD